MDADGSSIEKLTNSALSESNPSVMNDGNGHHQQKAISHWLVIKGSGAINSNQGDLTPGPDSREIHLAL